MKRIIYVALINLLGLTSVHAQYPESFYLSGQYALVKYDPSGFDDAEPQALVGRFGYVISKNFSIEARAGFGVQDDDVSGNNVDIDIDVESLYGAYLVYHSNILIQSQLYAIAGYSEVELEAEAFGTTTDDTESGASLGFGINLGNFNIEWIRYLDDDDYTIDAVNFGYVHYFN